MWYLPTNCPWKLTQFHRNALTDGIYCIYNPPMTATSGFRRSPGPPPSGDVLDIVPADRQGQQNGRQVWYFFVFFYSACNPVVRRGDTTWVLAQWWRPVASSEALDTFHWEMYSVLCRCISAAIERGRIEVHSFVADDFTIDLTLAYWRSKT